MSSPVPIELHQTLVWEMGEFPLLVTGNGDGDGYGFSNGDGCGNIGYGNSYGYGYGFGYGSGYIDGSGLDDIYINSLF